MRALIQRLLHGEALPLVGLLAFALLVLAFVGLAELAMDGDMTDFDDAVARLFRQSGDLARPVGPPWVQEAVRDLTALGSFTVLGLVLLASIGYLAMARQRGAAIFLAASVLGGTLVSTLLKRGFDRPRPDYGPLAQVFTTSFPSGHALLSAVTYLTIGIVLARVTPERHLRAYFVGVALILTLLVGTSRVYLGLHYASDVLAGWSIGAAWALLCWTVLLRIERRAAMAPPRAS